VGDREKPHFWPEGEIVIFAFLANAWMDSNEQLWSQGRCSGDFGRLEEFLGFVFFFCNIRFD
jgi:hypothetical protein